MLAIRFLQYRNTVRRMFPAGYFSVETVEKGLDLEILAKRRQKHHTKMVKQVEIVAHKPNMELAIF